MKTYNNKLIARHYFEEVLHNDSSDLIKELFAPESFVISDMIAEDDRVMVRWNTCPLSDVQFDQNVFAVYYLEDGMIVGLEMMDTNGVLRQIGTDVFSQNLKLQGVK